MRNYVTRYMSPLTLAGALLLAVPAGAQNPTSQTPTAQPQARADDAKRSVTLEGCLMREQDVPGRQPNVAERAGVGEDFILTHAAVIKGSAPPPAAHARPSDSPTGTAGSGHAMYEVEGLGEEKLKDHVGHRVQLDGTFENVDRAGATPESKTPNDDLVEIRATAIRHVSGTCDAK